MLEGGTVRYRRRVTSGRLRVVIENPCDADRPRRRGAGVGLSNVRARLTALHGHDARLTAGEVDGLWRVELWMPYEPAPAREPVPAEDGRAAEESAVKREAIAPESMRVVIVDDEPLARAVVREYLGRHPGVEIVAECGNGFEAVKAVTELAPDLLFLDVQMPKLSGFEVLELLGRDVPVDLHHGLRPVRAARVRSARRRLPAEAVQRGSVRRSALARAGAAAGALPRVSTIHRSRRCGGAARRGRSSAC